MCQGETFTFKLDQALAYNGGIFLVIEATDAAIDIRADYVAKYGAPSAAAQNADPGDGD